VTYFSFFIAAAIVLGLLPPSGAFAQTWPTKTITIVAPAPPGGATDLMARILADRLTPKLGQAVVVENREAAGGIIGTQYAAHQPADGYTLLVVSAAFATVPALQKVAYDPIADFEPISLVSSTPLALAVNAGLPLKSVTDLPAYAKSTKIFYGAPGEGSTPNFAMIMLKNKLGFDAQFVSYRGSLPVAVAVAQNEIAMGVVPVLTALPLVQSGGERVIGTFDPTRSTVMPDVPAVPELVPGVEAEGWLGAFAPKNTPRPVIDRLNAAIVEIVHDPHVIESKLRPSGFESRGSTPDELRDKLAREVGKYHELAKLANIKQQ